LTDEKVSKETKTKPRLYRSILISLVDFFLWRTLRHTTRQDTFIMRRVVLDC